MVQLNGFWRYFFKPAISVQAAFGGQEQLVYPDSPVALSAQVLESNPGSLFQVETLYQPTEGFILRKKKRKKESIMNELDKNHPK